MNAQNCPPQPQLNAVTMSLRGQEHCHFTAHMAAPLQLPKTLRAKPTSCCTQFKARTQTPVPHTPTDPNHWKLALLIFWSNLPSQTHSQAKRPCSPRILTMPDRPFIWEEQETGLQIAPLLMLEQGSTCAALRDSQLSHLPRSEQLFLASHPHGLLNT